MPEVSQHSFLQTVGVHSEIRRIRLCAPRTIPGFATAQNMSHQSLFCGKHDDVIPPPPPSEHKISDSVDGANKICQLAEG